jgi:hypothetical protein
MGDVAMNRRVRPGAIPGAAPRRSSIFDTKIFGPRIQIALSA